MKFELKNKQDPLLALCPASSVLQFILLWWLMTQLNLPTLTLVLQFFLAIHKMTTGFWDIFLLENCQEWSWLVQQIISKCETSILRLRVKIIKYIFNPNLRNMFWHFVGKNIVQITGNTALSPLYWLWFRSGKFYSYHHLVLTINCPMYSFSALIVVVM